EDGARSRRGYPHFRELRVTGPFREARVTASAWFIGDRGSGLQPIRDATKCTVDCFPRGVRGSNELPANFLVVEIEGKSADGTGRAPARCVARLRHMSAAVSRRAAKGLGTIHASRSASAVASGGGASLEAGVDAADAPA